MSDHKHAHHSNENKMEAVHWEGKTFSVTVKESHIPKIQKPLDAIIKLTSAAVCGSDLHTYRGRIAMDKNLIIGHEAMGIVHSVGSHVTNVKVGDRVVVSALLEAETDNGDTQLVGDFGLGNYGLPISGEMNGGNAEYLRVINANVNLLVLPKGDHHELDYLLLTDIFPTAWWALELAGQVLGDTVVVFGAGPVGLLTAYSAFLRGATRVYSVDHIPERLEKAKSIGAIPINFMESDPVAQIMKFEPNGVDRVCDCVGFECINAKGENVLNEVVNNAVNVVKTGGGIGLIGVYTNADVGAPTVEQGKGISPFPLGLFWNKSISMKAGVVDLRFSQELLKGLIESGKAKPSFIFDKEFKIEDGAKAYQEFADHKIIKPYFRFR